MKFKFAVNKKDAQHEDLEKMYTDTEGKPVDMTTLDRGSRTKRILVWLLGFGLLFGMIGLAGWFVFSRPVVEEGEVLLTIEAPTEVASGDTIDITVSFENKEAFGWKRSDVAMRLPEGFYVVESNPEVNPDKANTWDMGSVAPGAGGTLHLRGQIVGSVGDTRDIFAILSYEPENFKYDFQKSASTTVKITSSTIDTNIEAPSRASSTETMEYKATLINTSDLPLDHVRVYLDAPENFEVISQLPETLKDLEWDVEDWSPSDPIEITVSGILSDEDGETQQFGLRASLINEDGSETRQVETSSVIQLVNPELELEAEIDGSSEDALAEGGEEKTLEVSVRNNSDLVMRDIQIEVTAEQENSRGDIEMIDGIWPQTFGSDAYTELGELKPNGNEKIAIPFSVVENLIGKELQTTFVVTVSGVSIDERPVTEGLPTSRVTVKIPTTIEFTAEGRYYDDAQNEIGSGPLPPVVGEKTTFVVKWNIVNGHNDASNVTVRSELPEGVKFEGDEEVDEGTLTFDSSSRLMTWVIKKIPANSEMDGSFSISVTPEEEDVETLLVLTRVAELEGVDIWSGMDLSDTEQGLTSDLDADPTGEGRGIVVGAE